MGCLAKSVVDGEVSFCAGEDELLFCLMKSTGEYLQYSSLHYLPQEDITVLML